MTRLLLCLVAQSGFALDLLDKTNVDLVTKTVSKGVEEIMKEQQEKLEQLKNYSFAEFRRTFTRGYEPGQPEYIKRQKIFKKNLQYLIQHNEGPAKTYLMGINKFMDYSEEEFQKLLGYKRTKSLGSTSFLQGAIPQWNDTLKEITLPTDHDWRPKLQRSQHWFQDQGACGSCWATAAIGALQGHLEIQNGYSDLLSTQSLVSCTPNPKHCGGTGGCQGATAELAFEYIAQNGIPADSKWPYLSFTGANGMCTPSLAKMTHARIDHHIVLPENKGQPLLQAIYQEGPVVVSVDATNWNFYSGGVFSGCGKDAIINHAVVAEGFGEVDSGHKYYLIKNSWGADWGEKGYIRLMRFDDDEAHCGIDNKPEEGTACEGGPKFVRVCGMCGVLYDSTYPRGAKFITKEQGGTFDKEESEKALAAQEKRQNLMSMLTKPLRR
jgi:cathepsin L